MKPLSKAEAMRKLREAREGFKRVKTSSIEFPPDWVAKVRKADKQKGNECEKEDCDGEPLPACSC